jgi:Ca2+-binding EF-hand superfamily protein
MALGSSSCLTRAFPSASAAYVYDQHRLARRLRNVPISARGVFLRKKEEILAELLRMDTNADCVLTARELAQGMKRLGIHVSRRDMDILFAALDYDGDGIITTGELEVSMLGRELSRGERQQLLRHVYV